MKTTSDIYTTTLHTVTGRPVEEGTLPAGTEIDPSSISEARRKLAECAAAGVDLQTVALRVVSHSAPERATLAAWRKAGIDVRPYDSGEVRAHLGAGQGYRTLPVRLTPDGAEYLVGDTAHARDGWATLPDALRGEVKWGPSMDLDEIARDMASQHD